MPHSNNRPVSIHAVRNVERIDECDTLCSELEHRTYKRTHVEAAAVAHRAPFSATTYPTRCGVHPRQSDRFLLQYRRVFLDRPSPCIPLGKAYLAHEADDLCASFSRR